MTCVINCPNGSWYNLTKLSGPNLRAHSGIHSEKHRAKSHCHRGRILFSLYHSCSRLYGAYFMPLYHCRRILSSVLTMTRIIGLLMYASRPRQKMNNSAVNFRFVLERDDSARWRNKRKNEFDTTSRGASHLLELLAEVVVEPGVQDRIVAGTAHSEAVRYEEAQPVVGPIVGGRVKIVDDVDDVQR